MVCLTDIKIVYVNKTHRDGRRNILNFFFFQAFCNAYSFLSDVRAKEKEQLKQELKTLTDPKRKDKIKYLLQRMVVYLFELEQ
jgi:hypothetical protein